MTELPWESLGGGMAMYVRDSLPSQVHEDTTKMSIYAEVLSVLIGIPVPKNPVHITRLYRSPRQPMSQTAAVINELGNAVKDVTWGFQCKR